MSIWWAISSSSKIRQDDSAPKHQAAGIHLNCAANEWEAAQLVVRSTEPIKNFHATNRWHRDSQPPPGINVEILRVGYVEVARPTDKASLKGPCPDPLLPLEGDASLEPGVNNVFWIRVHVPPGTPAGAYAGELELRARGFESRLPFSVKVYGFSLPDRMTCTTAFGFSPNNVFRYHGLKNDTDKRLVLDKYWASFAAHHVSPYDPAPLDPIQVKWPDIRPPASPWRHWSGLTIVSNETHSGKGSLLIYDDKTDANVTTAYEPLIKIPPHGLRLKLWYRTAIPGHRFLVTLTHHDKQQKWMPGRNNDMTLTGNGAWQSFDRVLTNFPAGSAFVQAQFRATKWTDRGEELGLVWFDDISLSEVGTGKDLFTGGDFEQEPRADPVVPIEQLKASFDFSRWDRAMEQAIDRNHFNSFRVGIPGIGGGTFHETVAPTLLGFAENTPEYPLLFDSYCRQLQAHLEAKGWLDEAYVYWFDEPDPDQYPFVMNGFEKLRRSSPGIARMLTEQVEPGLIGGPNIWCSISDQYDHGRAEERRKHGEKFWWYVCTGPKAPYAGLFLDHPAPEMRIWLWQTFQRNIEGILVWETTYWTSSAAYPDPNRPQNPYKDPMSWVSGYSTPSGEQHPWGNGDGRFLYPPSAAANGNPTSPVLDGPVDSIRWEHLRDGIEDYEYLVLLRKLLAQQRSKLSPEEHANYARLLVVPESITRSLTEFAADGAPIEKHRHAVALAIESLTGK